jgi:UDP-3-O-[3-hydroxymyristoyl] glucosamine N-acyltransferase
MEFTAKAIAAFLKGEVEGNPDVVVNDVSKIEEGKPGTLTFLANPKYAKYIYSTEASVVLVNKDFKPEKSIRATLIRVADAYQAMASLLELAEQSRPIPTGVHPLAFISDSARIGKEVYIGPFSVIGDHVVIGDQVRIYPQVYVGENTNIGDHTLIYPGVRIYHACVIGKNCVIHAGTVIGSDGFGFAPKSDKDYKKIPQIGNVVIEDNVELGANCTIDRATMGSTLIKRGVKLDNMNHVAHNVIIGENTVIAAQSGIAGSTKIGSNCMFGGQVGIAPHIEVANGVKAAAQTGIAGSVTQPDVILMGAPAFEAGPFRKSFVYFRKFPELVERINQLEKEMHRLKGES